MLDLKPERIAPLPERRSLANELLVIPSRFWSVNARRTIAEDYEPTVLNRQLVVRFTDRCNLNTESEGLVKNETRALPNSVVTAFARCA
jgi:hypothetical protein